MRNLLFIVIFAFGSFVFTLPAVAGIEIAEFDDPVKEQLYQKLINELRCLVCQNQTIAGSNASLAKDLRAIVFNMINEGKTNDEIIDFMVQRYGDFVMYRPPFKLRTIFLWLGPFIFMLVGLVFFIRYIRKNNTNVQVELSAEDHQRAAVLLDEKRQDK